MSVIHIKQMVNASKSAVISSVHFTTSVLYVMASHGKTAPQNLTYCVHARGGWKRVGFAKAVCLFKPLNGRSTYCVEITNRLK